MSQSRSISRSTSKGNAQTRRKHARKAKTLAQQDRAIENSLSRIHSLVEEFRKLKLGPTDVAEDQRLARRKELGR